MVVMYLALLVVQGTGELHLDHFLLMIAGVVVAAYALGRTLIKAVLAWRGKVVDLDDGGSAPVTAVPVPASPAVPAVARLIPLLILASLVSGCVTSASLHRVSADGSSITAAYFSTKRQNWDLAYDPVTGQATAKVQADTPTGWTAPEVGGLAKDMGSAIGSAAGAFAGKAAKTAVVPGAP